jgi:hypothetical protein
MPTQDFLTFITTSCSKFGPGAIVSYQTDLATARGQYSSDFDHASRFWRVTGRLPKIEARA